MSGESRRVFGARYRWAETMGLLILTLIWGLFGLALAKGVVAEFRAAAEEPSLYVHGPLSGMRWAKVLVALLYLTPGLLGLCWVGRLWLRGRGGPVVLDDEGLSVTDWHGREDRLRWAAITELRATGRRAMNYGRIMDVRTPDRSVRLPPTAWPQKELVAGIVSRAHLRYQRHTWIGVVYSASRPKGSGC